MAPAAWGPSSPRLPRGSCTESRSCNSCSEIKRLFYLDGLNWTLFGDMMGGRTSAIAAGVGAALFVGYCIYFDRKRRSDPNFKSKLRERRRKQKAAQEKAGMSRLPDLKDAEAVQKFFLEEIQLGEELLAQGDYEKGVDHLTNAIAVCGQPQQLLQVLQQTLPPPVFQMLLTKLPTISQRIVSAQSLSDDDVE
ncbi:hypothetical protein HF521_022246 [Silurus meridionalis]|uniref:Mitochondrial import receptor subunit TOM20 homolog n=2 Tax=Silurus meridionalis TaxID=175797 RepID=A0A8T0B9G6_SILME|nr:hypothetical protein HF521_022246 [Silurus meridionalis]